MPPFILPPQILLQLLLSSLSETLPSSANTRQHHPRSIHNCDRLRQSHTNEVRIKPQRHSVFRPERLYFIVWCEREQHEISVRPMLSNILNDSGDCAVLPGNSDHYIISIYRNIIVIHPPHTPSSLLQLHLQMPT